jgi:hypothetical protein
LGILFLNAIFKLSNLDCFRGTKEEKTEPDIVKVIAVIPVKQSQAEISNENENCEKVIQVFHQQGEEEHWREYLFFVDLE